MQNYEGESRNQTGAPSKLNRLLAFLDRAPDDIFTHYSIAWEHLQGGNKVAAIQWFERCLKLDPDYIGAYHHMGKTLESMGKLEAARESYRRGIAVAKKAGDAKALGELQEALGEEEEGEYWDEV